jgi:glutathione S-transferase/RNA polymerase-associated protein
VVPFVNGAVGFGVAPDPASRLGRWLERANARPSVQAVRAAIAEMARLTDPTGGLASVRDLVKQGLFKREYRDHRLEWMVRTGGIDVVTEGLARNNIRFIGEFQA